MKSETFNRLGFWEQCAQLCWPQSAWCCSRLSVVEVVIEVVEVE